jgi:hypothetical protein
MIAAAAVVLAAFAVPAFAATNPFLDVPASHWAYDAVSQLSSRGLASGFPDGTYKGGNPATRYEIASFLARVLAYLDVEKASKQDLELIRRLVIEFSDELDALNVKVDGLGSDVEELKSGLGGWSISGEFDFRANFGGNDERDGGSFYGILGQNDFDLDKYRIWLRRKINDTTSFAARMGVSGRANKVGGAAPAVFDRYFITTKLGYDITFVAGRDSIDWETNLGLVGPGENDPYIGNYATNMFRLEKDWGIANLKLAIGRLNDGAPTPPSNRSNIPNIITNFNDVTDYFMFAGLANFTFSEQFRAGLLIYHFIEDGGSDNSLVRNLDLDMTTFGGYLAFKFHPSVEFKGVYYGQSFDNDVGGHFGGGNFDDSPSAWKAILDVKQDLLKFTSLWLEYGNIDNSFVMYRDGFDDNTPYGVTGADLLYNRPFNDETTKVWLINAQQKWNDKWNTFLRYSQADYDTTGIDDATNWTVGVGYQLNSAVKFTLSYDDMDYGNGTGGRRTDDDHVIRFRTQVAF